MEIHQQKLINLYQETFGENPSSITVLTPHASDRIYFRITGKDHSVIGTHSPQIETNKTFKAISLLLQKTGINCPEVLATDASGQYYIQEDVGGQNLRESITDNTDALVVLKKVLELMSNMHHKVSTRELDKDTGNQLFQCDLNNFKTHFLLPLFGKTKNIDSELQTILDLVSSIPKELNSFVHRDFQLRNIVVKNDNYSVVDFQNAFCGPSVYDIASLLFSSQFNLTKEEVKVFTHYYKKYSEKTYSRVLPNEFLDYVYISALVRILQALGSYGRIGIKGNKKQFLDSIPKATSNLKTVLEYIEEHLRVELPVLKSLLDENFAFKKTATEIPVVIISFSYSSNQAPLLVAKHINFILDARLFHNPGRDSVLKLLTGKDAQIKNYLTQYPEFNDFIKSVVQMITSVRNSSYPFSAPVTQISIYVGCTGGRHRSVAIAEILGRELGKQVPTTINHLNIT